MRILYAAIDQTVPGTIGGSVHVRAVAEGLAALGHEVHVLATPGHGAFPSARGVRWTPMAPPMGSRALRWARRGAITRIARAIRPDVVIERYYNFGGEGIAAGRAVGATTVLEVNAPVIDFPGSKKALLDRALLFEPMRRWRNTLCATADLIVTPSAAILPAGTPSSKIVEVEWGADTERFHPGARRALPFTRPRGTVAVFAGAFRSWHGAINLVRAMRELGQRGHTQFSALLIGEGPELPNVRREAGGIDGIDCVGAIPHDDMPAALAAADIGVAPFNVAAHPPLSLGFYWSPLKIFEYMASALPTVTIPRPPLTEIVREGHEGLHVAERDPMALARAIETLAGDATLRTRMGASARARVVERYSWARHCEQIEGILRRITS